MIAFVVETKVKGVVITSPDKFNACIASSNAKCPFVNNSTFPTSKY